MSFHRSHHPSHQSHVRFIEQDTQPFDDYRTYVTKEETIRTYQEPHFPNLHMMFKHKETTLSEDDLVDRVENVRRFDDEVIRKTSHTTTTTTFEEDVDMEAGDYIRRKHHSLSLQKLKSLAA